jgi:hypothetical protein
MIWITGGEFGNGFLTTDTQSGAMRYLMPALLFLAACASPAPNFFGAERHDVTLEGYRFVVFVKDDKAEVIRMGYLKRSARDPVPQLMVRAAEVASGCAVRGPLRGAWASPSLPGDTGEARFQLEC